MNRIWSSCYDDQIRFIPEFSAIRQLSEQMYPRTRRVYVGITQDVPFHENSATSIALLDTLK